MLYRLEGMHWYKDSGQLPLAGNSFYVKSDIKMYSILSKLKIKLQKLNALGITTLWKWILILGFANDYI